MELLVAAGGEHLAEAAGGLAGWAGAAVALEDLESQLAVWLPEGTVSALAAAVTRRVLCDEAGLAATKWATHAVSVDALAKFTEAAMAVADDVGLIDTDALAGFAAEQGWADNLELLVEACGFVRLFERLAVRQSGRAACRAALLEMKHAATVAEIAALTGLAIETAGKAVSGYRIGRNRYAAHTDARFAEFTAAVASVVDDVGLIDEAALREVGTASGWGECVDEFIHRGGYVSLSGLLALNDTSAARVKAALLHMGRGASVSELVALTGRHPDSVGIALRDTASCVRVGSNRWAVDTSDGTLSEFVEAVRSCADDVGLIDEEALRSVAAKRAWGGRVDDLIEACGFVRVTGQRLAVDATRGARLKAVLVDLGRPATSAEIAAAIGINKSRTDGVVAGIESVAHVGRSKWALKEPFSDRFHMAIKLCRDDVGLIDTAQLDAIAAEQGWQDSVEELIAASDLPKISGRLSISASLRARLKAALLNLGRPATAAEIAAEAGVTKRQAGAKLASIKSLTRVGSKWAPKGPLSETFHIAIKLCCDDVGLIDENHLKEIAAEQNWPRPVEELIDMCGLPRLSGRLAMADTAAAAKAVLLNLGRAATLPELANMSGHNYSTISYRFTRCESVECISADKRGSSGSLRGRPARWRALS